MNQSGNWWESDTAVHGSGDNAGRLHLNCRTSLRSSASMCVCLSVCVLLESILFGWRALPRPCCRPTSTSAPTMQPMPSRQTPTPTKCTTLYLTSRKNQDSRSTTGMTKQSSSWGQSPQRTLSIYHKHQNTLVTHSSIFVQVQEWFISIFWCRRRQFFLSVLVSKSASALVFLNLILSKLCLHYHLFWCSYSIDARPMCFFFVVL